MKLLAGFKRFRDSYFLEKSSVYDRLSSQGQSPKILVIGCSDSRVDPALLCSAAPGELFVVRNVANLVPPYEKSGGYHGVSSAIEFAVCNLKVETIIVLGHRQCGGIQALMKNDQEECPAPTFVQHWVRIAQDAKVRVLEKHPHAELDEQCRHCEMEAIVSSLANLRSFPFVAKAIGDRDLTLLGLYFDLERGEIFEYIDDESCFRLVEV